MTGRGVQEEIEGILRKVMCLEVDLADEFGEKEHEEAFDVVVNALRKIRDSVPDSYESA